MYQKEKRKEQTQIEFSRIIGGLEKFICIWSINGYQKNQAGVYIPTCFIFLQILEMYRREITDSCQAHVLLLTSITCCHCQRQNDGLDGLLINAIGTPLVFFREYRYTYVQVICCKILPQKRVRHFIEHISSAFY